MTNLIAPYASLITSEERKSADIVIFGDITSAATGWWNEIFPEDVSAYGIVEQLNGIPEDYAITVHINSNGGEVKEGLAIYNALKVRNVTTVCEGFAASAASVIFMAGKKRVMNAASLLFIHQAIICANGNPDELEKIASDLRVITSAAVAAYKEGGVTLSDEELTEKMKAETWITAEDAIKWGFATKIADAEEDDSRAPVAKNDAMRSIINMVTGGRQNTKTAQIFIDMSEQRQITERLEQVAVKFAELAETIATNPTPVPARGGNKGFFNFNAGHGKEE